LITAELAKNGAACITSSFQAECVVLVHMLKEQRPDIPVLFLETGYHFPETLAYRDQMTHDWNLNLVNLEAKQSVKEQEALFGILNQTEPSKCCGLRKVEPLFCRTRKLRHLVHGSAARTIAHARESARGGALQAARRKNTRKGEPAGRLDQ